MSYDETFEKEVRKIKTIKNSPSTKLNGKLKSKQRRILKRRLEFATSHSFKNNFDPFGDISSKDLENLNNSL